MHNFIHTSYTGSTCSFRSDSWIWKILSAAGDVRVNRSRTSSWLRRLSCMFLRLLLSWGEIFNYSVRWIWRTLTMVYNTQNHWVSGLCPSFRILNARKHNVSETGSVSVFRGGERDIYSVGFLRKSYQSSCLPPLTWGRKQVELSKRCVF
jgi:hypothetical protein